MLKLVGYVYTRVRHFSTQAHANVHRHTGVLPLQSALHTKMPKSNGHVLCVVRDLGDELVPSRHEVLLFLPWQGCGNDVSLLLVPIVSGSMESPIRSIKEYVVPFNDIYCVFFYGSFNVGLLALSASISAVEIDRCLEPSQVVCLSRESQRLICMINLPMV